MISRQELADKMIEYCIKKANENETSVDITEVNADVCEMLNGCRKYKVEQIAKHYGLENQLHQTQEECGELVQAISKYFRNKDKAGIVEEIADIEIMTSQLKYLMQIEKEVAEMKEFKVERQLGRIENEKVQINNKH